jgi:hypothetical protein
MSVMSDVYTSLEEVMQAVVAEAIPYASSITKHQMQAVGEDGYRLTFQPDSVSTSSPVHLLMLLTQNGLTFTAVVTNSVTIYSELHPYSDIPKQTLAFAVADALQA